MVQVKRAAPSGQTENLQHTTITNCGLWLLWVESVWQTRSVTIHAKFLEPKCPCLCPAPFMPQWHVGLFFPRHSAVLCSRHSPGGILTMELVKKNANSITTELNCEKVEGNSLWFHEQSRCVWDTPTLEDHSSTAAAVSGMFRELCRLDSKQLSVLIFLVLCFDLVLSIVTTWGGRSNLSSHIPIVNLKTKQTNREP